jgi:hypothetical protein
MNVSIAINRNTILDNMRYLEIQAPSSQISRDQNSGVGFLELLQFGEAMFLQHMRV